MHAPETVLHHAGKLDVFGVKLTDRKPRTPEEIQEIKQKIALVSKVFSKNYDLNVIPSGGGWACALSPKAAEGLNKFMNGEIASLDQIPAEDFIPKDILYDAKEIVDMPEDEIMGVIRHEVGHANNTDYRLFIQGQKRAKDEGNLPSSWASIFNACEDPWVNNREIAGSETVREKMTKLYAAKSPEILEKINTQPVTRQLGLNIIYHWLTGESIPTLKNEKVLKAFEKVRPAVERYFNAPTAQDNYDNLFENIWPEYKTLEAEAAQDEAKKELARQLSGNDLGKQQEQQQSQGQGGQGEGQEGRESDQSMLDKIRKKLGLGGKNGSTGSQPSQQGQHGGEGQDGDKDMGDEINKQGSSEFKKELKKELEKQTKELQQADQKLKQQGEKTGNVPNDIDLDKLPEDIKRELERIAKELSPKAKKELEKQGRKNLDQKQAEALKKDGPKHLEMKKDSKTGEYQANLRKAPSQKDIQKTAEEIEQFNEQMDQQQAQAEEQATEQQQASEQQRTEQARKEMEKVEMQRNGFDESEKDLYFRFKELENSMQQRIVNFMKIMDRYLPKHETYEYGGEHYTGTKLNKRTIPKRAPLKDYRIFERRETIESNEPRMFVELLIDNSGSMAGQKMEESLKTAIFWARVLKRFEIPFAIKFFGDHTEEIMKLSDDYDDPKKKIKPKLVANADASGGSTDMGDSLIKADQEMTASKRKFAGSYGAVFVVSDSGANAGMVGQPLKDYIEGMQKKYLVMNFILTHNPSEVAGAKAIFGESNVVAPANFEDLPEESFRILRVTLERILKIYKPSS